MSYRFLDKNCFIGAHFQKEKNVYETVKSILNSIANCAQLYISSPRGYGVKLPSKKEILETRNLIQKYDIPIFIHTCLLYNLNGCTDKNNPKYEQNRLLTKINLMKELDISTAYSMRGGVIHIGSSKEGKLSLPRIAKTITECLTEVGEYTKQISKILNISEEAVISQRTLILENCAGEGNKIGKTLREIREIIDLVDEKVRHQVKVCIDTAHIFGAGEYNLSLKEGMEEMLKDIDEVFEPGTLALFHLNDSEVVFSSKKDSHMNLFRGYIFSNNVVVIGKISSRKKYLKLSINDEGLERLKLFVDYSIKKNVPMILEPPFSGMLDIWIIREKILKSNGFI